MADGGTPESRLGGGGEREGEGASQRAAERMAVLAGISARLASVPTADLEQAFAESLDDLLLEIVALRWTLVFRPGDATLGGPVTPVVLAAVEEALHSRLPVATFDVGSELPSSVLDALLDAGVGAVLAVVAAAGGRDLAVVVFERAESGPWAPEAMGLARAIGDILGGALARRRAEEAARRADDRYRRLLETSAEGVCLLAADGTIQFANKAFASLVGGGGTLVGTPVIRYLSARDRAAVAARLLHESARFDVELLRHDGTRRWASCSTSALREDVADGSLALVMMTDISVRKAAEAAVRSSEARFRALVRSSSDVIIVTDTAGLIAYSSPAVFDVLGHDPVALLGTSPFDLVHQDDRPAVERDALALWDARTGSLVVRCRILTASGEFRHMEAALTNLIDDSAVAGMTITARDISAQLELQASLTHDANHDSVTGLPNRRVFNQRLTDLLRSSDAAVGVLFADLDGFKAVNDEFGHDVGDDLLRLVGVRLVEAVRDGDLVVRHGGDEFAVLCPGLATAAEAEVVAGRIVSALTGPFDIGGRTVAVGVSIGIALSSALPPPTRSARKLMAAADAAMYHAKSDGRGWTFAARSE